MKLFSSKPRTNLDPSSLTEPKYYYLDRSARIEAKRIRQRLQKWYDDFPDPTGDLLARFRSLNNVQHRGAAFELYVYSILKKLGYTITIHPDTSTSKHTKPDFKIKDKSGNICYVEAVSVSEHRPNESSKISRKNVVYDIIQKVRSDDFLLFTQEHGSPETPPKARQLKSQLEKWLSSIDFQNAELMYNSGGFTSLPRYYWDHENWEIEFTAIPRRNNVSLGNIAQRIGVKMGEVELISDQDLKNAILSKGKKYGRLDAPLIVFANANRFNFHKENECNILFGDEQIVFDPTHPEAKPTSTRAKNGVWISSKGIRYRRISAVAFCPDVNPWSMANRNIQVYMHPDSYYSISGSILQLSTVRVDESGKIEYIEGKHPRNILTLPIGWPEGDMD